MFLTALTLFQHFCFHRRYKLWMLTEYGPAVREGREKDVSLPTWFFPSSISLLAGSLILSLIHIDPLQRCTAAEALRHPWSSGEGKKNVSDTVSSVAKGLKPSQSDEMNLLTSSFSSLKGVQDKDKLKIQKKEQKERERRQASVQSPPVLIIPSQQYLPRSKAPKSPPSPTVLLSSNPSPNVCSPRRLSSMPEESGKELQEEECMMALEPAFLAVAEEEQQQHQQITAVRVEEEVQEVATVIQCSLASSDQQQCIATVLEISNPTAVSSPSTIIDTAAATVVIRNTVSQSASPISAILCNDSSQDSPLPSFTVATLPPPPRAYSPPSTGSRSNQTQTQSAPVAAAAFTLRRDKGQEGGQDKGQEREEGERRERFRAIREQQRQKEEAALAIQGEQPIHSTTAHIESRIQVPLVTMRISTTIPNNTNNNTNTNTHPNSPLNSIFVNNEYDIVSRAITKSDDIPTDDYNINSKQRK